MNSSFLYHAWGLYSHECKKEKKKGNILHVQAKKRQTTCPLCGSVASAL